MTFSIMSYVLFGQYNEDYVNFIQCTLTLSKALIGMIIFIFIYLIQKSINKIYFLCV